MPRRWLACYAAALSSVRSTSSSSPAGITYAIPFYTGLAFLERTLQSVLAQDDPSWSCVVCDEGKEPGVEELVRSLGDARVRYVRNQPALGMAGNFNKCVDVAETELVTVLHADDELGERYGSTMRAAAARHPQAAALFCRAQIIGPRSEPRFSMADRVKDRINPTSSQELVLAGESGVRALLRANFIVAPTLCFRKRVVGDRRFPAPYRFVLDWELTMQLLLDGEHLVGLPDRCYRYRRHEDNATERLTRTQERFREEIGFYERVLPVVRERGWERCVQIARQRRVLKLNVAFRALKSAARLDLSDALRGVRLLREL